ncbi:MAG: SLC13 family permease [Bacillota bacterium]|uniref:Sodium-dependent dicarboxylate transporter SdcS n=1 Tax=Thermanaerosceptrum fracticalcis TaxID=1712410 RepID=A0A7G6E310_THEFR|nr:DASS family sodium-coupled anion symporter [Thermanaerosceptrum fracticalcis]QNB46464.1 DASS family sodium-coupled anion symporter [Thermanaerosceptrum fracticalcis]
MSKSLLMYCSITILAVLLVLFLMPLSVAWPVKATTILLIVAIGLWIFQPIPLAASSIIVLVALFFLRIIPFNDVYQGFSNDALFILMTGMMIANGVNSTKLGHRIGLCIIMLFGSTAQRILLGIMVSLQVLAFIIPASAVRATLLLPIVLMIIDIFKKESPAENIKKLLLIGLAFGAMISGVGLITGAVVNPLTIEFIRQSTSYQMYYLDWMILTYPISILMTVAAWLVLVRVFKPEINKLPGGTTKIYSELTKLGKLSPEEKRCITILLITFLLWVTQKIHHLPVSAPALLAVALMVAPVTGITEWKKVVDINWGSILLYGASLSFGGALTSTGTAEYLAGMFLSLEIVKSILNSPLLAVAVITLFTQIYHLGFAGVTSCHVTLVPLIISAAVKIGANPVVFGLVAGIASLFGFILVVETLPNIVVFSSGGIEGKDLLKAGTLLSLLAVPVILVVVFLWWPLVGLSIW